MYWDMGSFVYSALVPQLAKNKAKMMWLVFSRLYCTQYHWAVILSVCDAVHCG